MSSGLYKYNGQKWNLDDRVYISDPMALWGYENNVWIGNDNGCIWKFTGDSYTQELGNLKIDESLVMFYDMAGSSNNEIYTVGYNGPTNCMPVIMKYNGSIWSLDKKLADLGVFNQIKYAHRNDKYYLGLSLVDYSMEIYEYDRKNLSLIYKKEKGDNIFTSFAVIDGYAYIVVDNKIYRYYNGNMEFIFEVDVNLPPNCRQEEKQLYLEKI